LEYRKLELEEKRIYLQTLENAKISEEKAREISKFVLARLRGYVQGKRAKQYEEEDTRLLVEVLSSLKNNCGSSR
jgi:hypothetical protein